MFKFSRIFGVLLVLLAIYAGKNFLKSSDEISVPVQGNEVLPAQSVVSPTSTDADQSAPVPSEDDKQIQALLGCYQSKSCPEDQDNKDPSHPYADPGQLNSLRKLAALVATKRAKKSGLDNKTAQDLLALPNSQLQVEVAQLMLEKNPAVWSEFIVQKLPEFDAKTQSLMLQSLDANGVSIDQTVAKLFETADANTCYQVLRGLENTKGIADWAMVLKPLCRFSNDQHNWQELSFFAQKVLDGKAGQQKLNFKKMCSDG